jgi:hypothetical protein
MAKSLLIDPDFDVVAGLKRQNLYQRLGLKTNVVSTKTVVDAYLQSRCKCYHPTEPRNPTQLLMNRYKLGGLLS